MIYKPSRCNYCSADTWCELRANNAWQCRACKVERFFERVLYPPLRYSLQEWQRGIIRDLYGTVNEHTGKRQYRKAFITVSKQNGKQLDINTPIPTPCGWKTMGSLQVGDLVFSEDGLPIRVISKSEIDDTERAFEFLFGDGTSIVSGENHQWYAQKWSGQTDGIFTTAGMFETQQRSNASKIRAVFRIPFARPIYGRKRQLPVHPYLFGFWLGNGSAGKPEVAVNRADSEAFVSNMNLIGEPIKSMMERDGKSNVYRLAVLKQILVGHFSKKQIPAQYLRSSIEQRWELLAGLMDSDGCISTNKGQSIYSSSVKPLADGVVELLRSLGVKATCNPVESDRYGKPNATNYRVQFTALDDMPCSRLKRKLDRRWKKIENARGGFHHLVIKEVEKRPMQCIEVDSPTHMYLAGESMVPTHNSFLVGGLPIYHLLMEEVLQAEAFGVASARDQAGITFNAAKLLVDSNPQLKSHLKVLTATKRIIRRDGKGLYAVLAADGSTNDGKRPSLLLVDELHRFTRKSAEEVHSVLTKGTISRDEPLTIQVTTSGDEHESPLWFSEYEYARHIIDGSLKSDVFYAKIWQADPKRVADEPEYWKSREARVAANPSHEDNGGFLKDERIVDELNEAIAKPEKRAGYIRLHLNVPIAESETPVIEMAKWYDGGAGVDLRTWDNYDVELLMRKWGLIEKPCVLGVDLAWTTDFTAMAAVFPPSDDFDSANLDQWKTVLFFWIPEGRILDIERRTRAPIRDWVRRGFMQTVPGMEMDLEAVSAKIKWAVEMFDVREVTFDPWGGMRALADKLNKQDGMTTVAIRQGYQTMSGPTKDLIAMHMSNRLAHGNNPILNWNASCLALMSDGNDNVRPAKPPRATSSKRIDGVVAVITALARATLLYQPESVYVKRGPMVFE